MNQLNLVLKTAFSLNAEQLLHVHLHLVSSYGQVIIRLFALFSSSQLLLLENLKYRAPIGKRVVLFELVSNANRAVMVVILAIV